MEDLKLYTSKFQRSDLNDKLKSDYVTSLKDPKFKALVNYINLKRVTKK